MRLTSLEPNRPVHVETIDWDALSEMDGRRLRELGLHEGCTIELLHRAGFRGRGAHACKIGRMIVAMRASHAAAITVRPAAGHDEVAESA